MSSPATLRTGFRLLAFACGILLATNLCLADPAPPQETGSEELTYRWHLGGFKGLLARLIVPGSGEATLRTREEDGRLITELHITSPDSRRGEFWRYGAELESADCRRIRSAWTAQYFRGRAKENREPIERPDVLDIPSTICRLRREMPTRPLETRIWSEGKVYPILIEPRTRGSEQLGDRTVATRTYDVRGVERPGEREWGGRLVLVLAEDEVATPLEIALVQPGIRLVLRWVGAR